MLFLFNNKFMLLITLDVLWSDVYSQRDDKVLIP